MLVLSFLFLSFASAIAVHPTFLTCVPVLLSPRLGAHAIQHGEKLQEQEMHRGHACEKVVWKTLFQHCGSKLVKLLLCRHVGWEAICVGCRPLNWSWEHKSTLPSNSGTRACRALNASARSAFQTSQGCPSIRSPWRSGRA